MSARHVTVIVFGVCLLICVVYDSIMAGVDNPATLSAMCAGWAPRHPFSVLCVGLALGTIIGHLFWYQVVKG